MSLGDWSCRYLISPFSDTKVLHVMISSWPHINSQNHQDSAYGIQSDSDLSDIPNLWNPDNFQTKYSWQSHIQFVGTLMLEDEMQALKTTIESSLQTRLCFLHAMGLFLLFFKDPPAVIKVNERGPPHVASWVHILSGKLITTKQPTSL